MKIPALIGNATVICYALTSGHVVTGNTKHYLGPVLSPAAFGLAICPDPTEQGYYLFYRNEQWVEYADTWHETVEDAKDQAEFEYSGIGNAFIDLV